jgi:two-component system, NarL family, invasion response regulator UvrY
MVSVLIADDHAVVRAGLKLVIEKILGTSTIAEAVDGDYAFGKIKNNDYDLLVLDVNMPNTDSFGLLVNILAVKPSSKILMCSMNPEEVYAKKYLQLGAKGYITKESSEEEFKNAINRILNNKIYTSSALSNLLMHQALNDTVDNPFELLSPRELEITQHLLRGESVAEISRGLNLHTSTIGTHKARIFDKLHCKNIVEISRLAKLHNLSF